MFAPVRASQMVVELDGNGCDKPLRIILGDINFAYESADKGRHTIRDSKAPQAEVLDVIQ